MIDVEYVDHMGTDLSVVNSARVSFHKESGWEDDNTLPNGDVRLIKFLARNGHWTPFGHTSVTVRVKAPVFVRTQCFKHKVGFVENEVSRRYVKEEPEFFVPESWRAAPENAKQGSGGVLDSYTQKDINIDYGEAVQLCSSVYHELIAEGVAPEQARMVLPQSMMTEWWWTGSVASFARMYNLRIDPHAQYEVRLVAEQVDKIIRPLFPVSWEALTNGNTM